MVMILLFLLHMENYPRCSTLGSHGIKKGSVCFDDVSGDRSSGKDTKEEPPDDSKETIPPKLRFKKMKHNIAQPPISVTYLQIHDVAYEDPFVSSDTEETRFKVGDKVMALLQVYSLTNYEKRDKWISPLKIHFLTHQPKAVLKDARTQSFHTRVEHLRSLEELLKPP